ncbi:MAG TPA: SMC-Scp complex subunit ScpB [Sporichthya sp.]|nr:SMC-Scp complex subunit ScpB [Sporichthya sp.]
MTDNQPPTPDEPGSGPVPPPLGEGMSLAAALEAVLFVVDAPVAVSALAAAFQQPGPDLEAGLISLQESLDARGSGLELRRVASGVRLYTRSDYAPWVTSFLLEGQRSRLSQAALETLAVIAYRQPVTRAKISAIRGVNVDSVVRTLTSRGLIAETETDPDTGGGLYCTTDLFLEKMGLRSLAELPSLAPMLPDVDTLDTDAL